MRTGANNWRGAPPPVGGRTSHVTSTLSTNHNRCVCVCVSMSWDSVRSTHAYSHRVACVFLCRMELVGRDGGMGGSGGGREHGGKKKKKSPGGGSDPKSFFPQPREAGGGCDRWFAPRSAQTPAHAPLAADLPLFRSLRKMGVLMMEVRVESWINWNDSHLINNVSFRWVNSGRYSRWIVFLRVEGVGLTKLQLERDG